MDYCDDTECQYYKQGICISADRYHSTDRFCITGRRKPRNEIKQMIKDSKPLDFKRCEKAVSN